MKGTTTALATVAHPAVDLNAVKFTFKLGDHSLPSVADLPATMALVNYVNHLFGGK